MAFKPGWYVVRVCPCCYGMKVTRPYPTEGRARMVMDVLLDVSARLET